MNRTRCSECGSTRISISGNHKELVCNDCGLILEDNLIYQDTFSNTNGGQSHTPFLATAGTKNVDGRIVKSTWLLSTREKNLLLGYHRIDMLASKLHLGEIAIRESKSIFKNAIINDLGIGRSNLSIAFASVYLASNIHGIPKTPLEIVVHSSVTKKALLRASKLLKQKLRIMATVVSPIDLVHRFASRLQIKADTVSTALEILQQLEGTNVMQGRHPETIVASALYLASKINEEKITQRDVANAVGVIEVTIRKRSKEILSSLDHMNQQILL